MSFEEFQRIADDHGHIEYSGGEAIIMSPPTMPHNEIVRRLVNLLGEALPELYVGFNIGLVLTPTRRREPDVAVIDELRDESWTSQRPHLVVEVISPSTRGEDRLRKPHEYLQAGIGQYWLVDRYERTLTVLRAGHDGWDIEMVLDDDEPTGEVTVGDHGTVRLDLVALLKM